MTQSELAKIALRTLITRKDTALRACLAELKLMVSDRPSLRLAIKLAEQVLNQEPPK